MGREMLAPDWSEQDADAIEAEKKRLENAESHLRRSNVELMAALREDYDPVYEDAITENEQVLAGMRRRVKDLENILEKQREAAGGVPAREGCSSEPPAPEVTPPCLGNGREEHATILGSGDVMEIPGGQLPGMMDERHEAQDGSGTVMRDGSDGTWL